MDEMADVWRENGGLQSPLSREYIQNIGMDCYGDEREAMNDFAKYYNNTHLSDVSLIVGDETFAGHRLILAKSSDVFDRMLSQRWSGHEKKDLEMVEDLICQKVFPSFLRFLYCSHVVLHQDNCLPLLILADKYNVVNLKKVCIRYSVNEIIPTLSLQDVFSIWFSYATKAFHQALIRACINVISTDFEQLLCEEWDKHWISLDRDQMIEILRSNQLEVANEYLIWEGVVRWINTPNHPERRGPTATPLISQIIPLIRFPYMTADELSLVERSATAESYPKIFHPLILLAYKWQALPLSSRVNAKEFSSTQFLLRNYKDVRWHKRISIDASSFFDHKIDQAVQFSTRSCTYPLQSWHWTVKMWSTLHSNSTPNWIKAVLVSEDIDSSRSIEYMLSVVDEKKVIKSFSAKKNFTKTRYSTELETDFPIDSTELINKESPLVVNGKITFQIILRPID